MPGIPRRLIITVRSRKFWEHYLMLYIPNITYIINLKFIVILRLHLAENIYILLHAVFIQAKS